MDEMNLKAWANKLITNYGTDDNGAWEDWVNPLINFADGDSLVEASFVKEELLSDLTERNLLTVELEGDIERFLGVVNPSIGGN